MHHLKDAPLPAGFPQAYMFATGVNEFRALERVAAGGREAAAAVSRRRRRARRTRAPAQEGFDEYVSDPEKPVRTSATSRAG